jgi:hypothetical protein
MEFEAAARIERQIEAQDVTLDDQAIVAAAIAALCEGCVATLIGVEMQGQLGAPDWTGYELRIWRLGESLRLFLKKKKRWRGHGPVLDAAAKILRDRRFGKGRQTFALLLGECDGATYSEALGHALMDPEVWGHAIKALTKAKIGGYTAEVAGVQAQETGWIRSAAKKYLQSFALGKTFP